MIRSECGHGQRAGNCQNERKSFSHWESLLAACAKCTKASIVMENTIQAAYSTGLLWVRACISEGAIIGSARSAPFKEIEMKPSTKDQMQGKFHEAKGAV